MHNAWSMLNDHGLLRKRALSWGLTQQQLADALGVHQTTFMRWERGERPVRAVFVRAALALEKRPHKRGGAV